MTACVDREVLRRFVAGTASGSERRQVVRHLLAGCGPCAAALRAAFRPALDDEVYDGILARVTAWARACEPPKGGRERVTEKQGIAAFFEN